MEYSGLSTVVSGGQTGSDQAGLYVAKSFGIRTFGYIPRGFRTLAGPMPMLAEFGLRETNSENYPDRTLKNAKLGDATVRLASDFDSRGEKLTLKYCLKLGKPIFDVYLDGNDYGDKASDLALFIIENRVETLNVAGNSDGLTIIGGYHFKHASEVLEEAFSILDKKNLLNKLELK